MVSPKESFPDNLTTGTQVAGRSLCNLPQQPTRHISEPLPRRQSLCSRRPISRLGYMGSHLSLSSESNDFEGFTQSTSIKNQNSNIGNESSGNNSTTVAPIENDTETGHDINHKSDSDSREEGVSRPDFNSTRLEVIQIANKNLHPLCNEYTIDLMSNPILSSSSREYERKWKLFMEFARSKTTNFNNIDLDLVISFLASLFKDKKRKASTISQYRTALTQPLFLYFNIDIRVNCVGTLLRSIKLKNPQEPPTRPTWNLNRVLSHLDTLDVSIEFNLLRKSAFLLLLATGWRISELHACVRDQEDCRFTTTQSLVLRPEWTYKQTET